MCASSIFRSFFSSHVTFPNQAGCLAPPAGGLRGRPAGGLQRPGLPPEAAAGERAAAGAGERGHEGVGPLERERADGRRVVVWCMFFSDWSGENYLTCFAEKNTSKQTPATVFLTSPVVQDFLASAVGYRRVTQRFRHLQ